MANNEDSLVSKETLESIKDRVLKAVRNNAPSHITKIDASITTKNGRHSVLFQVPTVAGQIDARAQEYGSGEHSTRNFKSKFQIAPKGKILIKPKKKKVLAFIWDKIDRETLMLSKLKFAGFGKDDRLMFHFVHHPGIQPYKGRGYLRVSMKETLESNKQELLDGGVKAIKLTLRRNFTHLGKKK